MPSFNKPRLYVALYPSGVSDNPEQKYHWAFLIGPKHERSSGTEGKRYHVHNPPHVGWKYEEMDVENVMVTTQLLARILIAKIEDEDRLVNIFRNVPIVQNDPAWRCRTWIASALEALARDGEAVGTACLDWLEVEVTGREYVAKKMAAGRYTVNLSRARPTWDMLEKKETIP